MKPFPYLNIFGFGFFQNAIRGNQVLSFREKGPRVSACGSKYFKGGRIVSQSGSGRHTSSGLDLIINRLYVHYP